MFASNRRCMRVLEKLNYLAEAFFMTACGVFVVVYIGSVAFN
jgi:hypothetical protein